MDTAFLFCVVLSQFLPFEFSKDVSLPFNCENADMVGYSFVQYPFMAALQKALETISPKHSNIIIKIETLRDVLHPISGTTLRKIYVSPIKYCRKIHGSTNEIIFEAFKSLSKKPPQKNVGRYSMRKSVFSYGNL
jgi:hypothetical protein